MHQRNFFSPKKSTYQKSKIICYKFIALLNTLVKFSTVRGQLNSLFQDISSTSNNKQVEVNLGPESTLLPLYILPYKKCGNSIYPLLCEKADSFHDDSARGIELLKS